MTDVSVADELHLNAGLTLFVGVVLGIVLYDGVKAVPLIADEFARVRSNERFADGYLLLGLCDGVEDPGEEDLGDC